MPSLTTRSDEDGSRQITSYPSSVSISTHSIPMPSVNVNKGRVDPVEGEVAVVRWNTTNLGSRLVADIISAVSASALIAPIISVIDRSIVEKAATGESFSSCLGRALRPALKRPHAFLTSRPFLLILSLYSGTYATANTVDTAVSTVSAKPASTVTSGTTKFLATSSVNMSLCVYKDSQFARMFGGGGTAAASSLAAGAIPKISYALFALRDSLTIFASFNLPPMIAPQLSNLPPAITNHFSKLIGSESKRANTAQFLAPAAVQFISTPIHLHGLDLYNRQGRLGFHERATRILRDWGVSAFARIGRVVPAFGVGGVVNSSVRRKLMKKLES
ncbi:hypothetical protein PV10_06967 [Exophiala mesophila]|uniref:Sequence orphan n=1 Tax=Exophiala mesophila TaxID=212818 RepID=A0A0D1XN83_EXOME|nr:uncharacterized protein PV10_06967 [Exophiala mesophila]KIV89581.1 hypothetical protein PV10_06967 [Exophiala mesophila]